MEKKIDRRRFIQRAIGAIIGLQIFVLFFSFFRNNKVEDKKDEWVDLGMLDEFEKGKTYSFPAHKLFLHRNTEGAFIALSSKCTHLGCAVSLNSSTNSFVCPCHASHFDKLGNVQQAPAKRPLDYFPVQISASKVMVDTSSAIKRDKFNNSQLTTA